MQKDELERIRTRVRNYPFEDGLQELALGCWAAVVGGLGLALPHLLDRAGMAVILALALLAEWGVKRARERLTYRRTGLAVAPHHWLVPFLVGFAMAAIVIPLSRLFQDGGLRAPYFLYGIWAAVGFLGISVWRRLARLAVVAVLMFAFALALALAHARIDMGMPLVMTAFGLALAGSGTFALWRYVRRTRSLAADENGRR